VNAFDDVHAAVVRNTDGFAESDVGLAAADRVDDEWFELPLAIEWPWTARLGASG
jgi:hypothetical protein